MTPTESASAVRERQRNRSLAASLLQIAVLFLATSVVENLHGWAFAAVAGLIGVLSYLSCSLLVGRQR